MCTFTFWQFDLQSNEKEKERLSAELEQAQSLAHHTDDLKRAQQENGCNDDLKVGTDTRKLKFVTLQTNVNLTFPL